MSVYLKLMKVQSELKAPKSQTNSFGKYKYRSCEDILEGVKPLLLQNKVLIVINDEIEHIEGRYYVKATATFIDAETGEKVEVVANAREPENKKGMDESQITGATSSYARKYALNGLLAIDDTKDADSDTPKPQDEPQSKPQTKPQTKPEQKKSTLSDKQIKRLYTIAKIAKKTEEDVKKWIKVKWNKESTKDLTRQEYDEICAALEIKKE